MNDRTDPIANLSAAKRALLDLRLKQSLETPDSRNVPRTVNREKANKDEAGTGDSYLFPTSFAQQRLWFLDQLEPNSPLYNIYAAVRINGPLSVGALQQALDALAVRHESLRTTFVARDGIPLQAVAANVSLKLTVVDLRAWPADQREAEAARLAAAEARQCFDLARGPLLRVTLLRLDETEYILLRIMHHIISDGWSMGVFLRELATLYKAFSSGSPPSLPALSIQYADFAVWQRQWLQGEVLEQQLSYWKQQLAGAPARLELPTDRPWPAVQSYRGGCQSLLLPQTLTTALTALSRHQGVTLFMTLLAAFQVLLCRYTGQEDIVVGTPIANRNRAEIEGLIGFFVNTLVLRADLSGNPTFRELLARVREVALSAYAHQDMPFERLVEALQPQRNLKYPPLFQVMFALQNVPMQPFQLSGLTLRPLDVDVGTAKFALSLFLAEKAEGLRATAEYTTDLFDPATIDRMLGHFQTLVKGIVQAPDTSIGQLPLLTKAERHQLLVEWNDTETEYPRHQCIHELFEAQVERTPEAIAVVFEGKHLTYQELNRRANRLAHYLRALGIAPDMLVGLCVERSLEMVVGLLGILKAGGAYVPLDSDYPQGRLAYILEDTKAPVVLTQKPLLPQLPPYQGHTVFFDDDWPIIANESDRNPGASTTPDNLAYVLYTSGSTGVPKGVEVCHRNIVRLVRGTNYTCFDENRIFLLLAPISFDASTFELWGALLHGARCAIYPDRVPTTHALGEAIQRHRVSTLWLTASMFNLIIDQNPDILASVSELLTGGEALSLPHVRRALERLPNTRLINGYGPTESTTFACCSSIPRALPEQTTSVSIGRPIGNTQVFVLDQHLQPVPIGIPGELYIGGDGLARGYLNRPELTAERFIPHPFNRETGARLYRTGDLARYRPDGNLEFLGRIDHQVKIRGFRVEPGETEALLGQHPAVRECVVIAREDLPGDKRLVAYCVAKGEKGPGTSELRELLGQKLPDYMIPAAFVWLDALPLTPNGKVDRRALPAPDQRQPHAERVFLGSRNAVEHQLTQIWEQVLGVRPIGVQDNFFELGGHSLLAVRLFAHIERTFGQALPLATLFQAPTIEHQARLLAQGDGALPWTSLVPIQPSGSRPPFFCVHAHDGYVFRFRYLAARLGPDQPFYGLQAQGLDGKHPIHRRVEDMAAHYLRELRMVQPTGPYFLGADCWGGRVAFEMAQQLYADGQQIALLVLINSRAPGFHRAAPHAQPVRAKALGLVRQIYRHLHNISCLRTQEKLVYLWDEVRLALASTLNPGVKRFTYEDSPRSGSGAQADAQEVNFSGLIYAPSVYPGRVTLLRRSKLSAGIVHDPQLGWGPLAADGVEVHEVPGYDRFFSEPRVRLLAERLSACLTRAQTT